MKLYNILIHESRDPRRPTDLRHYKPFFGIANSTTDPRLVLAYRDPITGVVKSNPGKVVQISMSKQQPTAFALRFEVPSQGSYYGRVDGTHDIMLKVIDLAKRCNHEVTYNFIYPNTKTRRVLSNKAPQPLPKTEILPTQHEEEGSLGQEDTESGLTSISEVVSPIQLLKLTDTCITLLKNFDTTYQRLFDMMV